jgi:hypothetical protein
MIRNGLIEPLGQDTYIIKIDNRNIESRGYTTHANSPYRTILRIIGENRGELSEPELMERLTHELTFDFEIRPLEFRRLIIELVAAGLISFDDKGYLHIVPKGDWARDRGKEHSRVPVWARTLLEGNLIRRE